MAAGTAGILALADTSVGRRSFENHRKIRFGPTTACGLKHVGSETGIRCFTRRFRLHGDLQSSSRTVPHCGAVYGSSVKDYGLQTTRISQRQVGFIKESSQVVARDFGGVVLRLFEVVRYMRSPSASFERYNPNLEVSIGC